VRLTAAAAQQALRGYCVLRRKVTTDWAARRGTVMHTPHPGGACIVIRWDGLKGNESWPHGTLEHIKHYPDTSLDRRVTMTSRKTVDSTSDERVVNNVMRHEYRVLSPIEKEQMREIKDKGLEFWKLVGELGKSREISLAQTRIEEATMWAIKHLTA
jgi:hypothetical protein